MDPILMQRLHEPFVLGFLHAYRPLPRNNMPTPVLHREPKDIIELAHMFLPFIQTMAKHLLVKPGDMMTALGIIVSIIGRGMHPTLNHRGVFDQFANEMGIVIDAVDKLSSSQGERLH